MDDPGLLTMVMSGDALVAMNVEMDLRALTDPMIRIENHSNIIKLCQSSTSGSNTIHLLTEFNVCNWEGKSSIISLLEP